MVIYGQHAQKRECRRHIPRIVPSLSAEPETAAIFCKPDLGGILEARGIQEGVWRLLLPAYISVTAGLGSISDPLLHRKR